MSIPKSELSLEEIRREIDAVDNDLLALIERRLAATGKVRATKTSDGSLAASPLRPAREAMMLRRLIKRGRGMVAPELLVRLWRVILSTSAQAQAPITLHVDVRLATSISHRLAIAEHFCGMGVETHPDAEHALSILRHNRGDLAILETNSPWAGWFARSPSSGVRLIASLPVIKQGHSPLLLIFGHAEPQPSGDDETVVISRPHLVPSGLPAPNWQVTSGSWTVDAFPGFYLSTQTPLASIITEENDRAFLVAGQIPSCIEVTS
jgi:chorismate mutase / prephenate dehydratase